MLVYPNQIDPDIAVVEMFHWLILLLKMTPVKIVMRLISIAGRHVPVPAVHVVAVADVYLYHPNNYHCLHG